MADLMFPVPRCNGRFTFDPFDEIAIAPERTAVESNRQRRKREQLAGLLEYVPAGHTLDHADENSVGNEGFVTTGRVEDDLRGTVVTNGTETFPDIVDNALAGEQLGVMHLESLHRENLHQNAGKVLLQIACQSVSAGLTVRRI